jgi:hypothetical protein
MYVLMLTVWQPGIGGLSTVLFGAAFSFIVIAIDRSKSPKVHAKLLSKPFIRLWNKLKGEEKMKEWIDYDDKVLFGKENQKDETKQLPLGAIPKAKLQQPN